MGTSIVCVCGGGGGGGGCLTVAISIKLNTGNWLTMSEVIFNWSLPKYEFQTSINFFYTSLANFLC